MANQEPRRASGGTPRSRGGERRSAPRPESSLSGDALYGERENLRRYRDFARDEHRRFATEYERGERGGYERIDSPIGHDRFRDDLTRSDRVGGEERARISAEREEASHRGRGPRGYQRSDRRIYEDVCERRTSVSA